MILKVICIPQPPPLRRSRFSAFIENLLPLSRCNHFRLPLPLSFPTKALESQHRSNLPPYFSWFCLVLAASSLSTQRKPRPSLLPLHPSLSHRDITLQQFRLWFAGSIHWLFDSCQFPAQFGRIASLHVKGESRTARSLVVPALEPCLPHMGKFEDQPPGKA